MGPASAGRLRLGLLVRRCGFRVGRGCAGAACRGGGLRKGLDRAAGRSLAWGLGLRVGAGGGRKNLRWRVPSVDLPPSQRSPGGRSTDDGVRRGSASPFSWTVPREGRSAAHPTPQCTHDSSFVRWDLNASALVTGSRSKRSILDPPAHERSIVRPPQHQPAARDPRPARVPAARSRPFRSPTPAQAEAAHQQGKTPAGSAPARSRPPRPTQQQPQAQPQPPTTPPAA